MVASKWADNAFDGEGARLSGGRWNSKGVSLVYLASSLALAALELLVHIDYEQALREHIAISVTFESDLVLSVKPQDLPATDSRMGAVAKTRALGDAWVRSEASVLLKVPSIVVPAEDNYLFNPKHPGAAELSIGDAEVFRYDPRLLKG